MLAVLDFHCQMTVFFRKVCTLRACSESRRAPNEQVRLDFRA